MKRYWLRAGLSTLGTALLAAWVWWGRAPCLIATVFGVPCPACGSTRSVRALLRGDWQGVLRYNPLGVLASVLVALVCVQVIGTVLRHGRPDLTLGRGRMARALAVAGVLLVVAEAIVWGARFMGYMGGPVSV